MWITFNVQAVYLCYANNVASIMLFQEDQLLVKSSQCEDLLADKKQLEHQLDDKKRYIRMK